MDCALVTAIGSFSADIAIKNLKKMGFRVIGCDIYPKEWVPDAYQVNAFYQAPYATKETDYINFIEDICSKEDIKWILPSTDVEVDVYRKYRDFFEDKGITICFSPENALKICRDKYASERFISKNVPSILTIPTYKMVELPEDLEFPIVCKLLDGRSSQGLCYVHSQEEWQSFVQGTENLENYVFQPYVDGNVVTVDVVRDKFDNCVAVPRKELLRTLNGAGTSVYVYEDSELIESCKELARKLEVLGCVNFEFILDSCGKYHFIECNPRFAGGVEFSCIAGYDCVRNHVKAFMGEKIDDFKLSHNQYIARKYEEYVTCVE